MASPPHTTPSAPQHPPSSPRTPSRIPTRKASLSLAPRGAAASHAVVPASPASPPRTPQRHSSMPVRTSMHGSPAAGLETSERPPKSPLPWHLQKAAPGGPSSASSQHTGGGVVQLQPFASPSTAAHPPQIRFPSSPCPSPSRPSHLHPHSPSHHAPSTASQARRCSTPRPKLERPPSTTYTTFPCPPPRTPGDEEDERRRNMSWGRRLISPFVPAKSMEGPIVERSGDLEHGFGAGGGGGGGAGDAASSSRGSSSEGRRAGSKGSQERERLLGDDVVGGGQQQHGAACVREREGLPKLSRACLVAEVKCYGKVSGSCLALVVETSKPRLTLPAPRILSFAHPPPTRSYSSTLARHHPTTVHAPTTHYLCRPSPHRLALRLRQSH